MYRLYWKPSIRFHSIFGSTHFFVCVAISFPLKLIFVNCNLQRIIRSIKWNTFDENARNVLFTILFVHSIASIIYAWIWVQIKLYAYFSFGFWFSMDNFNVTLVECQWFQYCGCIFFVCSVHFIPLGRCVLKRINGCSFHAQKCHTMEIQSSSTCFACSILLLCIEFTWLEIPISAASI